MFLSLNNFLQKENYFICKVMRCHGNSHRACPDLALLHRRKVVHILNFMIKVKQRSVSERKFSTYCLFLYQVTTKKQSPKFKLFISSSVTSFCFLSSFSHSLLSLLLHSSEGSNSPNRSRKTRKSLMPFLSCCCDKV